MQNTLSATQPENACSGRYVDPNVPWVPSPRPQPYPEFNPYQNESTNAVDHQHRPEGPVIPISWGLELSLASDDGSGTAASLRGACLAHNTKVPCDPFSRKRKRWSLMKKLRRYLGATAFPARLSPSDGKGEITDNRVSLFFSVWMFVVICGGGKKPDVHRKAQTSFARERELDVFA